MTEQSESYLLVFRTPEEKKIWKEFKNKCGMYPYKYAILELINKG